MKLWNKTVIWASGISLALSGGLCGWLFTSQAPEVPEASQSVKKSAPWAPAASLKMKPAQKSAYKPAPSTPANPAVPISQKPAVKLPAVESKMKLEEPAPPALEEGLFLAGRVLDEDSQPVAEICLKAEKVNRQPEAQAAESAPASIRQARTASDGSFQFQGLEEGEYLIATIATPKYPAMRKILKARSEDAEIILEEGFKVEVVGAVVSSIGEPLSGVKVFPLWNPEVLTVTDENGKYRLPFHLNSQSRHCSLGASLEGFREARASFALKEVSPDDALDWSFAMEPEGRFAEVRGQLIDVEGQPIADETVCLYSYDLIKRYQAKADESGHFKIAAVEVGDDYRIWVNPKAGYADYYDGPLTIAETGSELELSMSKKLGTVTSF